MAAGMLHKEISNLLLLCCIMVVMWVDNIKKFTEFARQLDDGFSAKKVCSICPNVWTRNFASL